MSHDRLFNLLNLRVVQAGHFLGGNLPMTVRLTSDQRSPKVRAELKASSFELACSYNFAEPSAYIV